MSKNEISLKHFLINYMSDIFDISLEKSEFTYIDNRKNFRVALIRSNNEQYGCINFYKYSSEIEIFKQEILNKFGITIKLKTYENNYKDTNICFQFYINREYIESLDCPYTAFDIMRELKTAELPNNLNKLVKFIIKLDKFTSRNI